MVRSREPVLTTTTSAMMTCAVTTPIPGISFGRVTDFAKGPAAPDRGLHQVDVRVDAVDPGQHGPQEKPQQDVPRVELTPSRP